MPKVLIIGAGMGGLALAQYLRHHQVDFEIFERDESATARLQGWALSLQGRIPSELVKIAPPSAPPLESIRVARELGEEFLDDAGFYQMTSLDPIFKLSASSEMVFLRAHRARLRQWLATDIPVSWTKRYVKHTVEADGTVTVYFEDGSTASGDLLVGADGAMSPVRASMGFKDPEISPVATIGGEIRLDAEQSAELQALGHSFFWAGAPDCFLFVGMRDVAPGGTSADYYWLLQWRDATVQDEGRKHWTKTASKQERFEFVKKKLTEQNMHTIFRKIVDIQPVDGILHSISYRVRLPERCPDGPVTLLGDSMHVMPPFRGQGVNNAIHDALLLGQHIVDAAQKLAQSSFSASEVIRAYEMEMIPRATGWVLASRQSAENFLVSSTHEVRTPLAPAVGIH